MTRKKSPVTGNIFPVTEYHSCRVSENEVNHKGHVKKPQKAVHVENVKKKFNFCKFIKNQVLYNVPNTKKNSFF